MNVLFTPAIVVKLDDELDDDELDDELDELAEVCFDGLVLCLCLDELLDDELLDELLDDELFCVLPRPDNPFGSMNLIGLSLT